MKAERIAREKAAAAQNAAVSKIIFINLKFIDYIVVGVFILVVSYGQS